MFIINEDNSNVVNIDNCEAVQRLGCCICVTGCTETEYTLGSYCSREDAEKVLNKIINALVMGRQMYRMPTASEISDMGNNK